MSSAANADQAEIGKFHDLAQEFWDPRGAFRPLHHLNPVRVEYVAARAPLASARVLDVGCGGGLLAEALAARGAHVTAIDLADGMIDVARLHAAESGVRIDYRSVAVESLLGRDGGDPPQRFDVITCMEMIEHVPDPQGLVSTLARLLKPDGALFISTLNRNLKAFLLAIVGAEYVLRLLPRGTHEYARFIRPSELARMARGARLELRDVSGLHYNPLNQQCRLGGAPDVNYLAHFVAEATH